MLPGGVVSELRYPAEQLERLLLRLAQLECPPAGEVFEHVLGLAQPKMDEPGVEKSVHVQQELIGVHRLGQVVLGPGPERASAGGEIGRRDEGKDGKEGVGSYLRSQIRQQSRGVEVGNVHVDDHEIGIDALQIGTHLRGIVDLVQTRIPAPAKGARKKVARYRLGLDQYDLSLGIGLIDHGRRRSHSGQHQWHPSTSE